MQMLNKKMIINFKKTKLNENGKDDIDITPDETIQIRSPEDIIHTIHYLLDSLSKYIIVSDVLDFEEIYKNSKKD